MINNEGFDAEFLKEFILNTVVISCPISNNVCIQKINLLQIFKRSLDKDLFNLYFP